MKRLLIIDSNSILNRAFYGVRFLSAKDGTPTNAVYGFLNILFKLISEEKPDYICAAFDVKAPTFRHMKYDGYKAQRKPMPEDLAKQMPIAKDILKAMEIPVLELEGYEADDIIGTVSRICEENGTECLIATGDKDDLQLASSMTKVILTVTRMGNNETTVYDDEAVKDRYNVTPREFIDVKALMGDPSDNIPGVAGIGEKTAMELISKFGSIEYIYNNIDDIGLKGARLAKLKAGRDAAFMSRELAEIDRNAPMEFNMDACRFNGIADKDGRLYDILRGLDLNSVIKKAGLVPKAGNERKENVSAADFFEGAEFICVNKETAGIFKETLDEAQEFSVIIDIDGEMVKSAAAAAGKRGFFFDADAFSEHLAPYLADENKKKITFNIKDVLVYTDIVLNNISDDLAVAAYLVNPSGGSTDIVNLAERYLGVMLEENKNVQMDLFSETPEELPETAEAKKALAVLGLKKELYAELEKNSQMKLYRDIELPLVTVLADMQKDGILIDAEQLKAFGDMLSEKISSLTEVIYTYAGEEFNINSPKQLGEILFEKLGLKTGKRTKSGYSTNAETLEKLADAHPIVPCVLEYRQLAKLKSTYCDGLAAVINPDTGRIHSAFNQMVTVTGRISSTEPNMQNIPVRTELGRELRKMFIAKEGCVLVDADYSQIELRVLAHIADDAAMINAFKTGEDIHTVTASQVFGVPVSEVTSRMRRDAKAVNFGIVYGIGEFSLSKDIGTSVKQAKLYMDSYLEKYSGVREYMKNIKEQAKKDGYVKTLYNRIRYIPELKSTNYNMRAFGERVALNTPIQGTAADIIKLAMVRVHKRLSDEGLASRLILQVHDELLVEAKLEEKDEVEKILREEMENAMSLSVPLEVDMSSGKSWYDAK